MTDGALDHSMLTDGTTGGQCAVHRRVRGCRQDRGSSHRRARLFASSGRVGRARRALTLFGIFEIHESAATPRCLSVPPPLYFPREAKYDRNVQVVVFIKKEAVWPLKRTNSEALKKKHTAPFCERGDQSGAV